MSKERERTEFGNRLYRARKHAKLNQAQLAKLVGMSQGTLGEAEYTAQSSSYTLKIAAATGVRVEWLVLGHEPMVGPETIAREKLKAYARPAEREDVEHCLQVLGELISGLPPRTRRTVSGLLADWAEDPTAAAAAQRAIVDIVLSGASS